jgi:hypothetical protein
MKTTSIALCRVSTVKQQVIGTSLEAQEKRVYDAAQFLGADIEKFWSLSVSSRKGKNFKRRDLHEMLAYAKQFKRVQYIIVDEVDRFMRGIDEFYYWKLRFREEAGAKLIYAAKPGLTARDDIYSAFEEMIDVFKAEASNQERITKTTEKMQARIMAGYYPGQPKQGYQRTLQPGLHEPKQPEWDMLKLALNEVTSQQYLLHEALQRLNSKGYRTNTGRQLQMDKFKTILIDPYYAGIVQKANWPSNKHGLHKAMITVEQHETLKQVVAGKKKVPHKQFNKKYLLSNVMDCTECLGDETARFPKLVGYDHHNGKQGERRKYYEKYRCRTCGKERTRKQVHDGLSDILAPLRLAREEQVELIDALRIVWKQDHQDNAHYIQTLQTRSDELTDSKNSLVLAMATGKISEPDGNAALEKIKSDISDATDNIETAQNVEHDFVEFVQFTLGFIDELQNEWWELDQQHLRWCKQLLFPDGFSVSRAGKVYTPTISEFYRVATMKKDSEEPSFSELVTPAGFEPAIFRMRT